MPDIKAIADLSSALLTPVIGVVTTITLVNQYRLEKNRLRLDLFEKRYVVYKSVSEFIISMIRTGTCTQDSMKDFLNGTIDHIMLFENDISNFIDETWKIGIDLQAHHNIYKTLPQGEERTKHIKAESTILKKLPEISKKNRQLFASYLELKYK